MPTGKKHERKFQTKNVFPSAARRRELRAAALRESKVKILDLVVRLKPLELSKKIMRYTIRRGVVHRISPQRLMEEVSNALLEEMVASTELERPKAERAKKVAGAMSVVGAMKDALAGGRSMPLDRETLRKLKMLAVLARRRASESKIRGREASYVAEQETAKAHRKLMLGDIEQNLKSERLIPTETHIDYLEGAALQSLYNILGNRHYWVFTKSLNEVLGDVGRWTAKYGEFEKPYRGKTLH